MAATTYSTPAPARQALLSTADLNTEINHEPRVAHRRLAASLAYGEAHKLGHLIERHRDALKRFGAIPSTVDENGRRGRPGKTYWLNKRQALYLCTKSEAPLATETTIAMVEVFDDWQRGQLTIAPLAPGLMHMLVGRRLVMVDANDFQIGAGDEAVVCGHEGKLSILRGPLAPNASSPWLGARSVFGRWRKPGKGAAAGTVRERPMVTVLGRLMEPGERRRRMIPAL